MTRRAAMLVLAVVGALAGAAVVLSVPVPGPPVAPDPEPARPAPVTLGPAPTGTMLAWTPGRLPPGFASAARAVRGVRRVAVVRSGTTWMTSWRDAGKAERRPPEGMAVPVEVAAVEPGPYAAFVPPAERALISSLEEGGALLGTTGALLRDLHAGGSMVVNGRRLRIHGVVDDELIGAHEIVVARWLGADLGIARPRYLLVEPGEHGRRGAIERRLRRALPAGVRLRVRGPGETPVFRHGDAVLPPVRLKQLFGEFGARPIGGGMIRPDPAWVAQHIRTARVPILGRVTCHRVLLPQLRSALRDIERAGLAGVIDTGDFGGCFSPRYANRNADAGLSHHSWGVAVDLNVSENGLGASPRLDRRIVEVFERWGFTWGGRWLIPDGMHFEFLTFPPAV